jgi:hypothetical protein
MYLAERCWEQCYIVEKAVKVEGSRIPIVLFSFFPPVGRIGPPVIKSALYKNVSETTIT